MIKMAAEPHLTDAQAAERPVIACRDVGDFDDYLSDGKNSLVLSRENTEAGLYETLKRIYHKQIPLTGLGTQLKKTVTDLYSIGSVLPEYERFHKK